MTCPVIDRAMDKGSSSEGHLGSLLVPSCDIWERAYLLLLLAKVSQRYSMLIVKGQLISLVQWPMVGMGYIVTTRGKVARSRYPLALGVLPLNQQIDSSWKDLSPDFRLRVPNARANSGVEAQPATFCPGARSPKTAQTKVKTKTSTYTDYWSRW